MIQFLFALWESRECIYLDHFRLERPFCYPQQPLLLPQRPFCPQRQILSTTTIVALNNHVCLEQPILPWTTNVCLLMIIVAFNDLLCPPRHKNYPDWMILSHKKVRSCIFCAVICTRLAERAKIGVKNYSSRCKYTLDCAIPVLQFLSVQPFSTHDCKDHGELNLFRQLKGFLVLCAHNAGPHDGWTLSTFSFKSRYFVASLKKGCISTSKWVLKNMEPYGEQGSRWIEIGLYARGATIFATWERFSKSTHVLRSIGPRDASGG